MFYAEAKVYSDGSHYIAIPHSRRYTKRRKKELQGNEENKEVFEKVYKAVEKKRKSEKK